MVEQQTNNETNIDKHSGWMVAFHGSPVLSLVVCVGDRDVCQRQCARSSARGAQLCPWPMGATERLKTYFLGALTYQTCRHSFWHYHALS